MLEWTRSRLDGEDCDCQAKVRAGNNLPIELQFWMASVARDLLQLGVFFRAAAIMCQVPGGARCQFVLDGEEEENWTADWVVGAERNTLLDVLAECLRRLGAKSKPLMRQVLGREMHWEKGLPAKWKEFLDQRAKIEDGLLNVVAECLDELIVRPGVVEIDAVPRPTWWQKFWARIPFTGDRP